MRSLKPIHKKLLLGFLGQLGDVFSNAGCNDWEFPDDWTDEDILEVAKLYSQINGNSEDYSDWVESRMCDDFSILSVLEHIIEKEC